MNIIRNIAQSIRESAYTKYIVTILIIVLVVGVLDENSLWNRRERTQEIEQLTQEIADLKAQYEEDTRRLNSLNDYDCVERLAREKYLMHRPDEDIYIIKYTDEED